MLLLPASPDDEDVLEVDADDGDEVGRSVGRSVKRSNVLNVANVLVSCRGSGTIEIFPLSPL